MPAGQLWLEDFSVGERFEGEARRLDEAAFEAFARLTGDAHPIHYDAEYARKSRFGGRVAHGLLLAAMSALGATALSPRLLDSMVALAGQGFRYKRPVLVGDSVRPVFTVELKSARPEASSGVVRFKVELLDGSGALAAEGYHEYVLRKRPA